MRYGLLLAVAGMVSAASSASAAVQVRVAGTFGSTVTDSFFCINSACALTGTSTGKGSVGFTVFVPDSVLTDAETIVSGTSADGLTSFGGKIINTNGFLSAINLASLTVSSVLTPNFTGVRTVSFTTANIGTVFNVTAAAVPEPATWALMLAGFGMVGYALRRRRPTIVYA